MIRRAVAITVAATILLSAGVASRADALDKQRSEAVAELASLAATYHDTTQRTDYLEGVVAIAEQDTAERTAVLALRSAFLIEIEALSSALEDAEGRIDTATHRAAALAAQGAVVAEKTDPDTVTAATATVHALAEKVDTEVDTWQAAQSVTPGGIASTSGGSAGYARVRAALDLVGGGGIGLYESASCAGGTAPACANSNGYIKYRADIAGWSTSQLNWAMAHELAHIYQFRVWGALTSSGAYGSLFGNDPEFLANCMAVVRGYPGSVGCNGEQQAWASGIWVGAVR